MCVLRNGLLNFDINEKTEDTQISTDIFFAFFLNRWIWILIGEKASIFNLRNTRNTRGSQLKFWKDFLLAKHNFSVSSYNTLGNSPKIKNCKHYLNQCNVWGNSNTHLAPMLYGWLDLFLNICSGDVWGNSQKARNTLWR